VLSGGGAAADVPDAPSAMEPLRLEPPEDPPATAPLTLRPSIDLRRPEVAATAEAEKPEVVPGLIC
jgi:hypothetical protein